MLEIPCEPIQESKSRVLIAAHRTKNTTEGGSPQHTKLKNQQQQEKIESVLFFFAERKQKVAVNFKDV